MTILPGRGVACPVRGFLVWRSSGSAAITQFFEQALVAKLLSLSSLTPFAGASVYKTALPQTHDLGAHGPAVVYTSDKDYGHVLAGSDGTSVARVVLSAFSYNYGIAKQITEVMWSGIDGVPATWGNGSCEIIGVVQQDDSDNASQPKAGSDQWMYRVDSEYSVKYRVTLPTLA